MPGCRCARAIPNRTPRPRRHTKNFTELVAAATPEHARGKPIELWWQDEARIGQQGSLSYIWAPKGSRPRAPRDQRYDWAYLFGAVCPARGIGAALVLPLALSNQLAQGGRRPYPLPTDNPFKRFNSSPEIIRLAVTMYVRYPLSLRNVEDQLAERGIDICHETIRLWWNRFGPMFAAEIKKRRIALRRGCPEWQWHLDEVFVRISGETHYLWRAVDHEGEVLEVVATERRDRKAALRFLKRLMKRYGRPHKVVTDRLPSYGAAMKVIGNADRHECKGGRINNRAENSHQPFRRRERTMLRFRSMKTLQKFASVQDVVHNHFNHERHLTSRAVYKQNRSAAMAGWRALMG